jgi:hypothetical protein
MALAAFMHTSSVLDHARGGSILNVLGGKCTEMLIAILLILFLVGMHLHGCQFPCPLQHRVTPAPPSGILSITGNTIKLWLALSLCERVLRIRLLPPDGMAYVYIMKKAAIRVSAVRSYAGEHFLSKLMSNSPNSFPRPKPTC